MRNIEAKMAAFTDAGLYEQDSHIDFEAEEHVYLYDGSRQLLPVSSLIAYNGSFIGLLDSIHTQGSDCVCQCLIG